MIQTEDIASALCRVALWLLVMSLFFGPAGLHGSIAFASASKACGVSCPCDEGSQEDNAEDQHDDAEAGSCADGAASGHENGSPCEEDCPDDCPNCSCWVGAAMAVLPLSLPTASLPSLPLRVLAPLEAPVSGAGSGVFRPPRALA